MAGRQHVLKQPLISMLLTHPNFCRVPALTTWSAACPTAVSQTLFFAYIASCACAHPPTRVTCPPPSPQAMGGVIHLTEPLWSRGMWLLGDNFYSNKRSTTTTTSSWGAQPTTIAGGPYTTQGGYSPAAGYAPSANGSRLPGAAGGVAEVAGAAVGAVTGTASAAVDTVADIGSAAVGGVLDLGSYVFNTVTGTIGAAARVAQQYAGAAVDTAAAAVGTVRDTAADAVSTASTNYHAAKDETYTTVDSNVRRTAERVEGKVERAAEVAEETADAAHAGYARGKVEGYDAGVAKVQRVPGVSTHSVAPAGIY